MRLAITDANIFIDLFYLKITDFLFRINCEVHTTHQVILELEEQHQEELKAMKDSGLLNIQTVEVEDINNSKDLHAAKGLSMSDKSVLLLADKINGMVLSGDDLVRKTCKRIKIEVHGILWLIDQFVQNALITNADACAALKDLMDYNKRLPRLDCKRYVEDRWEGSLES